MTTDLTTIVHAFDAKLSNLEQLISTIDGLLNREIEGTKPYTLLDLLLQQGISPLDAYFHNQQYYNLKSLFPSTIWGSVFLSAYALLEYSLDKVCDFYVEEKQSSIIPNDLKDKGITRSATFLTKVIHIDTPFSGLEWESIRKGNQVRNCLAHNVGDVSEYAPTSELKKYIEDEPLVSVVDNHLVLSKEYVQQFIQRAKLIMSRFLPQSEIAQAATERKDI